MSQHYFDILHDDQITTIFMGWDEPLQGYFLVVEKPGDGDTPYWCNPYHANESHPKTLEPFMDVLDQLGIKIPMLMIEELLLDKAQNASNKQVWHFMEDGQYSREER